MPRISFATVITGVSNAPHDDPSVMIEKMNGGFRYDIPLKDLEHIQFHVTNHACVKDIVAYEAKIFKDWDIGTGFFRFGCDEKGSNGGELEVALWEKASSKDPVHVTNGEMESGWEKVEGGGDLAHPFDDDGAVVEVIRVLRCMDLVEKKLFSGTVDFGAGEKGVENVAFIILKKI